MMDFALAALVLAVIVLGSLKIENLLGKLILFTALGLVVVGWLGFAGGTHGKDVLIDVFLIDYPQFIGIPLVTVAIASLRLFGQTVPEDRRIGWFLWLAMPLIGNFATTWAVTPVTLSLIPHLRRAYPHRWVVITIVIFTFAANFLAMATLLADPPQSYWAIRAQRLGTPLGFFFPLVQFWPYLLITWGLYGLILRHLGVQFGDPRRHLRFGPESWGRLALGVSFAAVIGVTLTFATGYWITVILGLTVLLALILARFVFVAPAWHDTTHWLAETAATFIAFFAVVALVHAGLSEVDLPDGGMVAMVVLMTMGADNAAAFAAGFAQFVSQPQPVMVWYNLFNAIAYGGLTPLGNGPQITLFLVILVGMRHLSAGRVFGDWMRVALVLAPYLLVWTVSSYWVVSTGGVPDWRIQLVVGAVALLVAIGWLELGTRMVPWLDPVRHHRRVRREPSR